MNLKVAIVGLPNAGKSTLFNALLKRQVAAAANYPFTTIEPNIGVVPVPDPRLEKLAEIYKSPIIPAVVEFVDVAGLVAGASEGKGLGNKFLSHIRECHIIVNVLRYFEDPTVVHVAGDVDPKRDEEIIKTELILADLQTLEKQKDERYEELKKHLENGGTAREIAEEDDVSDLHLLTMKPVLSVANVGEFRKSPESIIEINAKTGEGIDTLIRRAYELLGLISFLTAGVKEVRAWTIEKGTNAQKAAGVIHTDFEKKFIKADVIPFADFVTAGGWTKAREIGKVRSEGREYEVKDGDVVEFKVGA